jgi:transcriptional regulator with XRE-family HTH domain
MKTKSFQAYLEKRLSKEEIADIREQAQLEAKIFASLQKTIQGAIDDYMKKNKVGFNELVRRLDTSPSYVQKLKSGNANITLAKMAHLLALLGKEPGEFFKK